MSLVRTFFVFATAVLFWSSPGGAGEVESGAELFALHCAVCHGADGRGAGAMAQALKTVPADLTQLSARNGGAFPRTKVQDVIRNGGNVLGHGSSSMLAWGLVFSEKFKPELGRGRIGALADYLEHLQAKP